MNNLQSTPRGLTTYGYEDKAYRGYCNTRGISIVEGYLPYAQSLEDGYEKYGIRHRYSAATHKKRIAAAKRILRDAYDNSDESMDGLVHHKLEKMLAKVKYKKQVETEKAGVPDGDLRILFAFMQNMKQKCIGQFMLSTGCRVGEVVKVLLSDVQESSQPGYVSILIDGKGNKQRRVFVSTALLAEIREAFPKAQTYLFESSGHAYSTRYIYNHLVRESQKYLGYTITPHQLRHTWANLQVKRGREISAISRYLGHADISTTCRYYVRNSLSPSEACV